MEQFLKLIFEVKYVSDLFYQNDMTFILLLLEASVIFVYFLLLVVLLNHFIL